MSSSSSQVNEEELETLKRAFGLYDRDGDGTICAKEFGDILKNLHVATQPDDIEAIVRSIDSNKDGRIDFEEFVEAMARHLPLSQKQPPPKSRTYPPSLNDSKHISVHEEDELLECFRAFDKNNDGFISRQELEEVMSRLGENLSPQEISDMMNEADTNKDGQIDFKEFKKLIPPS